MPVLTYPVPLTPAQSDALRSRILSTLDTAPDGLSWLAIVRILGTRPGPIDTELWRLILAGEVARDTRAGDEEFGPVIYRRRIK